MNHANLLVDARGNLWITDFGLAQFRTETNLTKTGDLLGTIRYMSPEQAAANRAVLDHRTDVYSLGATMYELATLQPIFDDQDSLTLLRKIQHDEPKSPRSIEPSMPIELETIVLKCVSKSPGDRYASALDLAADLQRFIDDQPILARRPTAIERAARVEAARSNAADSKLSDVSSLQVGPTADAVSMQRVLHRVVMPRAA